MARKKKKKEESKKDKKEKKEEVDDDFIEDLEIDFQSRAGLEATKNSFKVDDTAIKWSKKEQGVISILYI